MAARIVQVRYRLHAERVEENLALVAAVFAELTARKPPGLRYHCSREADGRTFLHRAEISTADGSNPLLSLPSFLRFTSTIAQRCEEPPATTVLQHVGEYAADA